MGKGWKREKQRHSLAAKGISSSYQLKVQGKPHLAIRLPKYARDQIKQLTQMAHDGQKEWIAEFTIINGDIIINDVQISEEIDHSYLKWDTGDEKNNIGYIHFHPQILIPEFSEQDFVLAMNLHDMRKNKEAYPYTLMGLVYPDKGKLVIRLYAMKPNNGRAKDFNGENNNTEANLQPLLNEMMNTQELLKLKEVS